MSQADHTLSAISAVIDKLRDLCAQNNWKAFTVTTKDGASYVIDKARLNKLRREHNTQLIKQCKSSGRRKVHTEPEKDDIIKYVTEIVDESLVNSSVKVSKKLKDSIVNEIRVHATKLPSRRLKKTLFKPRLLYVIDDHLKTFLENINLSLLVTNFTGSVDASIRKELTVFESDLLDHMVDTRINASTLLNALIVHYTKVKGLRKKHENEGLIKLDDNLHKLVNAPMNSLYKGKSLASKYKATDSTKEKKDKEGNVLETTDSLAGYREKNPNKSVREYLESHPTHLSTKESQIDNHITAKSVMAIVSGHIIPKSAFEDDQHANFSMETKDGKFVNKSVYVLLAVQAMISSTLPESATVDERTRSPTRSSSRSRSRSLGKARSIKQN